MRRFIVICLSLFMLLVVIPVGLFTANEWHGRPIFINNFFNRFAIKIALDSPETLTTLRFLEPFGIDGHNAELDDASPEAMDRFFELIADEHEVLKSYNDSDLNQEERLSKRVATYLFEFAEEAKPFRYHNYPVNQLFGIQNGFPTFMESQHQIGNLQDAEYYIERLKKLPNKFEQSLQGIKLRTENGIIPPGFVINRVVDEMSNFVATQPEENILYTSFVEKLEAIEGISEDDKKLLMNEVSSAINDDVYPAYQRMTDYFVGLLDKADDKDGFWKLPNGDEAYRLALKLFTSTDYTPDYIHNVGLQEVARIQQEIIDILDKEGFDTASGFSGAMQNLASQERFYYEDSDQGRQQILDDYKSIIADIEQNLEGAFNIKPKSAVDVKRIPEFREKTAPGAYYNGPAMDGSRPGIFYANLYDIKATPKYSMKTLAYHEAIPGHHFQIAIAQELEGLPLFRKFAPFTAYLEGWALYSERLVWELGFLNDPYDNIGRLQAELFRAVRLVVDTGIHAKKWTRDYAISYMMANTGMAETDVQSEIERYIVMPGQACAYKVGMMKILELRAKVKDELGDAFSLPEFHDVVLRQGAVPLDVLAELVDDYIADKKRKSN